LQCWGTLYDPEHSAKKFSICVNRDDCGKDGYKPTGDSAPESIRNKDLKPDTDATCTDPNHMTNCIFNDDCKENNDPPMCGFY